MHRFLITLACCFCFLLGKSQHEIYVAGNGNDVYPGTFAKPVKTLQSAIKKASAIAGKNVLILLREGTYELHETLVIAVENAMFLSLEIQPYKNEKVIISGSTKLALNWQLYKNGIYKAMVRFDQAPDQLFLDGTALQMARYPNYNNRERVYNGTAADAIGANRVSKWQNPAGGFIHALHEGEWGDFHYVITGKKDTTLLYEGGWQNNRPAAMHRRYRFVENIAEELDAPGEWFYDKQTTTLYIYPPANKNLHHAVITSTSLTDLFHITGNELKPVKNITISGLQFTQTARSFMQVKEPLLRSDWMIYRGGAILLDRTENITIRNCEFNELGSNAIFVSNYNKNSRIIDNHIHDIGANAIAFVGNPNAVRSPSFRYENYVAWTDMDFRSGPKTNEYPQYCMAAGNLIHHIGNIEKQVAGVEISMSFHVTVTHNTICNTPRSGINISEGTWGGHMIAYNDVFNTVLETGDHGAFNSWGRDRYWRPERNIIDSIVAAKPGIELVDVIDPITIRNNRFRCDHGWDIDLDDGSSKYLIYNNICLNGGLKLREGYHRTVTNNILINNSFHPHVWLKNSGDIFMHNIVSTAYAPILMQDWGNKIDSNFFLTKDGLEAAQTTGLDKHSAFGNAMFTNAAAGNYTLLPKSAAFNTGFKNIDAQFGVTAPRLKHLAARPPITPLQVLTNQKASATIDWLGATTKNIETLGEQSATGLLNSDGVLIMSVTKGSLAEKSGLRRGDVLMAIGDHKTVSVASLLNVYQTVKWMGIAKATVHRNQQDMQISLAFK